MFHLVQSAFKAGMGSSRCVGRLWQQGVLVWEQHSTVCYTHGHWQQAFGGPCLCELAG
jgi:hypothetical protein